MKSFLITINQVLLERFEKFMCGQTMFKPEKNEVLIYPCDLELFLQGKPNFD